MNLLTIAVGVWSLRWCGAVVRLSYTYMMAESYFDSLDEVVLAGNTAACAARCMGHDLCGAFTWDSTQVPSCILHTEINAGQTTRTTGKPYRSMTLTNHQLFRLPRFLTNDLWQIRADQCENFGLVLLPPSESMKDQITVGAQGQVVLDIKVSAETGDLTTNAGGPVDPTYMRCVPPGGAIDEDQCFGADRAFCFYQPCSFGFENYSVNVCGY